jgi:hypothetical protein
MLKAIILELIFELYFTNCYSYSTSIQIQNIPWPGSVKLAADISMLTEPCVLDALFPSMLGGTCAIFGTFGCGKTIITLANKGISHHSCCRQENMIKRSSLKDQ